VRIARLSPVIGERFIYTMQDSLELVLTDGTNTAAAGETTTAEAEEIVEAVQNGVATQRSIRFIAFQHQPLMSDKPLETPVVGKTYRVRWNGQRVYDGNVSDAERTALDAYVRHDTGEPDMPTFMLTERDFTRGVPWEIPADQPAPFARGLHERASITLTEIDRSLARFAIEQVMILELRDEKVPITLRGTIVMDIASARITSVDVEGHITERTGPVQEAHMTSHQTFTYPR